MSKGENKMGQNSSANLDGPKVIILYISIEGERKEI